jgi:hypothetical protein
MTAYIGYHHGLLQGAIFACITFLVIAVGVITYQLWVARAENRHIERDGGPDRSSRSGPRQGMSGGGA